MGGGGERWFHLRLELLILDCSSMAAYLAFALSLAEGIVKRWLFFFLMICLMVLMRIEFDLIV